MSQIVLEIQTNDNDVISERRFPLEMTTFELKNRLELISGAQASTMTLTFKDTSGNLIGQGDDAKCLKDYLPPGCIDPRLRLHVKDSNAVKLDDLSQVPKYEMNDDDYSKRAESLRAFKMKNKLGRFSADPAKNEQDETELLKNINVGSRCEVTIKNMPPRRGTVMYVGKLGSMQGNFVGVRYDEPYGKNDGSFENVRYFECPQNYGSFVRPNMVKCGDFPELEVDFDDLK